jgi:leucine dehydrogenase
MLHVFAQMSEYDHEQVVFCRLGRANLRAIIAIHDTTLGPALGGTRMWPYASETEALHDVLNLSRDMTYKAAAAGLKLGGGKAVILGDPKTDKTEEMFSAFGRFVDTLGGRYIASEDVGTEVADIDVARRETEHVVGTNPEARGSGDPSPMTALGVFHGIRACTRYLFDTESLAGLKVAVQGAGKVGSYLVWKLAEAGAEVVVADIDERKVAPLVEHERVTACDPQGIYDRECDFFAPCALGNAIDAETEPRLKCRVVAGGANTQLESPDLADRLHGRGILYIPDFIINAGGLINVASEVLSFDREHVEREVAGIYDRVARLLEMADGEGKAPLSCANRIVEGILDDARRAPLARKKGLR